MSRALTGITHAVVSVPEKKDAHASNTYATVELCFGPGDDTALTGFRYIRNAEGKPMWQGPMYEVVQNGRLVQMPVFKGELLLETVRMASRALSRIKKDLGEAAWGKRYHVFKTHVVPEDLPKE
jgi:hypothetical protein